MDFTSTASNQLTFADLRICIAEARIWSLQRMRSAILNRHGFPGLPDEDSVASFFTKLSSVGLAKCGEDSEGGESVRSEARKRPVSVAVAPGRVGIPLHGGDLFS